MNWEAIGAVGEILGAIGVIATLLYLTRQISLSSKAQKTATQHNILSEFRAAITQIMNDQVLNDAHAQFISGQELDEESRLKMQLFISTSFASTKSCILLT